MRDIAAVSAFFAMPLVSVAWTFAGEGKRVAVVERKYIGGACPKIALNALKNAPSDRSKVPFPKLQNPGVKGGVKPGQRGGVKVGQ